MILVCCNVVVFVLLWCVCFFDLSLRIVDFLFGIFVMLSKDLKNSVCFFRVCKLFVVGIVFFSLFE